MRSREALANWLLCTAINTQVGSERFTFASDPIGGDGVIYDTRTEDTWPTEHVMVPKARRDEPPNLEELILHAIDTKQEKGGAAYASGKTLIVFLGGGSGARWFPNKVAKRLPKTDFHAIWIVGLHLVQDGQYVYSVSEWMKSPAPPPHGSFGSPKTLTPGSHNDFSDVRVAARQLGSAAVIPRAGSPRSAHG